MLHKLIYSNWLIAFSAAALTLGFCEILHFEHRFLSALLIGFGTLFMYNFQRILAFPALKAFPSERLEWMMIHKTGVSLTAALALSLAAVLSFLAIFHVSALLLLLVALLLGVFYSGKVPGLHLPLREIPYIKIHVITLVWLMCCGYFPWLNSNTGDSHSFWFITIHYAYLIAITIPFDIRDIRNDYGTQKTIPQVIGVRNSVVLGQVLLLVFAGLAIYLDLSLIYRPLFSAAVLYQLLLLQICKPGSPDWLFSGMIDGGIILLGLSYCSWPL
jgi:hypothetical protein